MLDDQPCGDDYDLIYTIEAGMPRFSPDSTRTEYMAHNGKSWFVVVDGKHLVYAGKRDGKALLVLDGKPGETYDRINEDTVKFSPASICNTSRCGTKGKWWSWRMANRDWRGTASIRPA
jgi:hypothetical protein